MHNTSDNIAKTVDTGREKYKSSALDKAYWNEASKKLLLYYEFCYFISVLFTLN